MLGYDQDFWTDDLINSEQRFDGQIDDIIIFKSALKTTDVGILYDCT
jgi:hypothetical protein